jgi:glutaredoxin
MRTLPLTALAFALAAAPLGAAQLYRWVDDKGRVEWRDTPPPPEAKNVEQRNVGANTIQTSTVPYGMQQAIKNFPVTLWAFDCGEPCTVARNHLVRRGVPYTERNAQRESEALKKLTGQIDVPVLLVGTRALKGYLDTDWDAALDAAGYPRTAPPGMKPQAQAPAAKPAEKAAPGAVK